MLLSLHNTERAVKGIAPLVEIPELSSVAARHAEWMSRRRKLSHYGWVSSPSSRIKSVRLVGVTATGENIATAADNTDEAIKEMFRMWMRSAGHRDNILNPRYSACGIGSSGKYWCVDFVGFGSSS
jgi:uncharacterized protein YkwD